MNNDQYQNPLDCGNFMGSSLRQLVYKYVETVCEEQDSIIESHIRKIGGTEFEKITIDRDKVIEALTMYRDKDQYEKIRHAKWEVKDLTPYCTSCHKASEYECDGVHSKPLFCPNCGAHMDEEEQQ